MERHFVSPATAAVHLGVSTKTLRRYIASGRLTAYRVGNKIIRLDLEEVDGLLHPIPTTGGTAA